MTNTLTVADIIGSLTATLESRYSATMPGSEGLAWDCDGRDLELVVDKSWHSETNAAVWATVWDVTDEDPVQLHTLRIAVDVIA